MNGQATGQRINVAAFIWALLLAPLCVGIPATALGWGLAPVLEGSTGSLFWIAGIATILGAPTYLTFGTYFFVRHLRRFDDAPVIEMAWAGLLANLASTPAILLALLAFNASDEMFSTAFLVGFGCIFAPLWGANFGWLYARFSSCIPQTPS